MGCTVLDNVNPYWVVIRPVIERAGYLVGRVRALQRDNFLKARKHNGLVNGSASLYQLYDVGRPTSCSRP
jgi:hypothetical protein